MNVKSLCLKLLCYSSCIIFLLAGCLGSPSEQAASLPAAPVYWPAHEWQVSLPEEQGMDSEMLGRMFQQVEDQQLNLHSLLIVRNGYLVTEAYFHPYDQDQPQYLASISKSVISTLVGIAIQKGYIQDIEETLVSFFPDRTIANLDARKKAITLQDLLTLRAGLACSQGYFSGMDQSSDWVQFMLDTPMAEQPGTKFNYCGGAVHLLSAILQRTTGMSTREFANRFLFEPIGIARVPDTRWPADPQGIPMGPTGLYLTPRDLVKLGTLYLQNGAWGDQQIVPAEWVKSATASHTSKDNELDYGYLWTVDPAQGSYSALGLAGQEIIVIPSRNLVIVFTGTLPSTKPDEDFLPLKELVDRYILPSLKSDQALPDNSAAVGKVKDFVRQAAHPQQALTSIPEGALVWSGFVYQLDPNPFQWESITFDIQDGADSMTASVNGQVIDPPIGLDRLYRVQEQEDLFSPLALRGRWEDERTLAVQMVYLGEIGDIELQIKFSAGELNMTIEKVVTGEEFKLYGERLGD
jgi:CubicO group peptidase (beta-lactamase class C family)